MPYVLYPVFFLTCFLVSLYLTFPMDVIKPRILDEMNRALNARKSPGAYGKPGRITLEDVNLYRFSGVDLRNVTIWDVTTDPDPASPIQLDRLQVRVGIFALLRKQLAVSFNIQAYDGTISGEAVVAGEGYREFRSLHAQADGVAWGKIAVIHDKLKVPCDGTLGGDVELNAGKDIKDASGIIHLKGEGLGIGPGELSIPSFGTLTLPKVDLGKLAGEIKIADGKSAGPPVTLTGNDIQGQADLPATLRIPFDNTMVAGAFQFKLSEPFLKANPRYATVFDLTPAMKSSKDEEGVFHFRVKGPLARLDVKPDRTARVGK
jgi:type II secretion system protein N